MLARILFLLIPVLLLNSPTSLAAVEQQKQDKIFTLMKATGADHILTRESLLEMMRFGMEDRLARSNKSIEESGKNRIMKILNETLEKVDFNSLKLSIAEVYDYNYTEEELDAMIAFYSSPIGQKVVSRQTQVIKDTVTTLNNFLEPMRREILAKAEKHSKKSAKK